MDNKTHLGLFPLRIFLFPGEQTTLHLFEPRYLQLSTDCINNNECFGIPYQGKTTLSELGSLVKIVQILKKYENGEVDILIECTNNFKINHFPKYTVYSRLAGAEKYPETIRESLGKWKEVHLDDPGFYGYQPRLFVYHIEDIPVCIFNGPHYEIFYEGMEHYWS